MANLSFCSGCVCQFRHSLLTGGTRTHSGFIGCPGQGPDTFRLPCDYPSMADISHFPNLAALNVASSIVRFSHVIGPTLPDETFVHSSDLSHIA